MRLSREISASTTRTRTVPLLISMITIFQFLVLAKARVPFLKKNYGVGLDLLRAEAVMHIWILAVQYRQNTV
jgi:hypothetical protein